MWYRNVTDRQTDGQTDGQIINGIYNVKTELFFDYDHSGRRGHSKKLFRRRSRLDIRKFAFSNRIVHRWNSLSECCVTCNSINCFKSWNRKQHEVLIFGQWALYGIKPVAKPSLRRYWWPSVNHEGNTHGRHVAKAGGVPKTWRHDHTNDRTA